MERQDSFGKYAIFQIGSRQYQGIEGKTVAIEKIDGEVGSAVEFKGILLKKNNENIEIGQPFIKGAVKATIVKHMQGPKIVVFKFKRRKKSRVKKGHRQPHTIIRVDTI